MRSVEIAGTNYALRDSNADYEPLAAQLRAGVQSVIHDEWLQRQHTASTIGYWRGEAGLRWNDSRNEADRQVRDRYLGNLAGGTLLDLGCGELENVDAMRWFLRPYRPGRYIGVDHLATYGGKSQKRVARFGVITPLDGQEDGSHGAVIHGDMLQVLSRLPTASMNAVALNGMDRTIVDPHTPYGRAVIEHTARVVRDRGLVWGVAHTSGLLSYLQELPDFRTSPTPGSNPNFIPFPLRASNDQQRAALRMMGVVQPGYYFLTRTVRNRHAQPANS